MNKIVFISLLIFGCSFEMVAQNLTPEEYINQYKELAITEMKRMGVPAAITLAQGLLETQNGNSDLLKASNNHFGIKCKSTWTAETVSHDDDAPGECFRKYPSAADSYRDHSNFLRGNSRYDFLFKLDPSDYKGWAYGLRKAGYATNPRYPQILIKNIEKHHLEQYTDAAIDEIPVFDGSKYANEPVPHSIATLPAPDESKAIDGPAKFSFASSTISDTPKDENNLASQPVALPRDEPTDFVKPGNVTINGLKALYVPKGTSLLAIASENRLNLAKLLAFNDLTKDGILDKSQYIFLQKKQKEGSTDFCIAQEGETMYDIAQRNGVILQNLYSYNQFAPGEYLDKGAKIFLRPGVAKELSDTDTKAQTASLKMSIHEVLPKENLYSISRKYGVSVDQLKSWNNLVSDHLQIGQQLIISK